MVRPFHLVAGRHVPYPLPRTPCQRRCASRTATRLFVSSRIEGYLSDNTYSAEASHTRQPTLIGWPAALLRLVRPLRRPGDAIDRLAAGRELAIVFATALLTQLPFVFGTYPPTDQVSAKAGQLQTVILLYALRRMGLNSPASFAAS